MTTTQSKTSINRRATWLAALWLSTSLAGAGVVPVVAHAQAQATYNIPAQSLTDALPLFGQQSGLQVSANSQLLQGVRTRGVRGQKAPAEALGELLAGTGLTFRISGTTVVLDKAPVANGAIQLGAVRVEGAADGGQIGSGAYDGDGGGNPETAPYRTAGAVSHISQERIARFRGSSPADIFRGTPGVLSGEARNGAGSIDVNIRGMQGFGRVATTIDGAENAVTVYQGYQGVTNRTYVDPDFIASIDITKGSDASSFGTAGSVAMRTLDARDIVAPGETWGLRLKGGFGSNTSAPVAGSMAGFSISNSIGSTNDPTSGYGKATASPIGMDRPGTFEPTSGSFSAVGAYKGDALELVAGYAFRDQGNYHAGENGPSAQIVSLGQQPFCYSNGNCPDYLIYRDYLENSGLVNYRAGEEVLNTELRTESWLGKATGHFGDGHTLQLGLNAFRSQAGDRLASRLGGRASRAVQQSQTANTSLDTYTARYRWKPADNDLIDLKANAYWTHLELRNTVRGGRGLTAAGIGLPANFLVGSDTNMWGADVSNLSKFAFDNSVLDLTYGAAYRVEDTRGSRATGPLEAWMTPRDAVRQEFAGFVKAAWQPVDWATLNGGLRYAQYSLKDRFDPYEKYQKRDKPLGLHRNDGGFSPSLGVTFVPLKDTQVYINYSSTLRAPSILETVSAFNSVIAQPDIKPERSDNWEIGGNLTRNGLLFDGDEALFKLSYFNWDVKNYLSRNVIVEPDKPLTLNIDNIPRAKFAGAEFSSRYQAGGLTAELAANYFFDIEFCRTKDTCGGKSLYGDYATNHVPPKYTLDLTVSQSLLADRLTLGGRASHVAKRAIGHGDVTAQGAAQFISLVDWKAYTLIDLFADYRFNDRLKGTLRVENLTDKFYVDPLGLVTQPGPGRTVYASLSTTFGGAQTWPWLARANGDIGVVDRDWTGLYLGAHTGMNLLRTKGVTTKGDGSAGVEAARESAHERARSTPIGGQLGYNYQFGNGLVVGAEAEYSRTYLHAVRQVAATDPMLTIDGYLDAYTTYDIDWTASLRARLGYAVSDRLLVYGTAGPAWTRETQWRDQYVSNEAFLNALLGTETGLSFTEKASAIRNGYTAGFGAEYALSNRWSVRADYSYSDFGKQAFAFPKARAGTGKDWTQTVSSIIGYETIDYANDPDMAWICPIIPELCIPFEQPIYQYDYIQHQGSGSVVEGRKATNRLNLHEIKLGLNYRF